MPPIIEEIKEKKIAIMGFGREGKSVYQYIRKYLPTKELTIADEKELDTSTLTQVETICGAGYQELAGFDVIFKSPGIVLNTECPREAMDSMTNKFLKHYGKQTIGITGTKGKSTTASLLYHILKENGKDVLLLGNIGKPAFDALEQIKDDTLIIFELSCHQLEYVNYAPHIAVLLNIYEEHLDHYGTYEKYIHAKENIWRCQSSEDLLICEKSLVQAQIPSQIITASMEDKDADILAMLHGFRLPAKEIQLKPQDTALLGHHNMYDIAIDIYLAQVLGISITDAVASLHSFTPLTHRLQYVGKYAGLHWYDDSISTICETTMQALNCLPDTDTLLIGGMDRGIDYTPLAQYLSLHPVNNLILMPDSGAVLGRLLGQKHCHYVQDLKDAVALAKRITQPEKIVLLSPAAASYGFFKNFEERGDAFQEYVKSE